MRKRVSVVLLAACILVLFALPISAEAATTNAFGLTYAGQSTCAICHSSSSYIGVTSTYAGTAHGKMVTNVVANPDGIVPAADSGLWPSPGPGIRFGPADMFLVVGGAAVKEYVGLPKGGGGTSAGGQAIPAITPADDYPLFDPMGFNSDLMEWEGEGEEVGVAAYFQRCGGCHNLGVTRPSNATVTLANGATISPTTPTGYAGLGIQCEVCHGTGSTANSHMGIGVGVVKFPRILTAEVCGQCHASGTTVETRLGGTSSFSNANGYTTDEELADYITPYTPENQPARFYPDGHNKGMGHVYYNEWLLTGHAESRSVLKDEAGDPLPFASEECMRCHSTEGYLKANGYQSSGLTGYTPSPATDETDIECALCHTVHDKTNPSGALGLRVEETEVCSQCHNAEIEEGATIVAGEAVHHPQKEMLEGYGLIGVADMGPSMGSATCVDCHMPETRAGRLSHVFTPMLPGNAEAWGVPELGDSCTPCHESTTRSTLQGNIDGWQAEVDALIANIDAVIAAAPLAGSSIPEFNGAVIDAAVANAEYVTADASGGVHNIRYARAGLTKALYYARAAGSTIDLTGPATADAGSLISLTGTLEFGDGGVGAAQTIKIMKKAAGSDTAVKVATVVTNGSGVFTAQIHPGSSGEYTAVWTPLEGADLTSDVHALTTSVGAALFADVPSTHIFFNYIQGLAKFGVVQGFSPGIFGPDAPVLRAQAAKMLVNALGFGSTTWTNWGHPTFVDVPQPAAQTEANRFPFDFVEKAYVNDIVKGVTATTFVPYGNITRWQLALMIARAGGSHLPPMTGSVMPFTDLAGVSNEVQSAILLCHDYGILDGTSATTFDPWSSATRGQAAKMIWNLAMLTGDLQ